MGQVAQEVAVAVEMVKVEEAVAAVAEVVQEVAVAEEGGGGRDWEESRAAHALSRKRDAAYASIRPTRTEPPCVCGCSISHGGAAACAALVLGTAGCHSRSMVGLVVHSERYSTLGQPGAGS